MAGLDVFVPFVNAIRLDRQLRPIFCSKLGTCYDVDFCAVTLHYSEILISIANLETQTVDKEVKAFVQGVVEDLRNDSLNHLRI